MSSDDPRTVGDVMTTNLVTLSPGDNMRQAIHLFSEHKFRHLLVAEGNVLHGVLSDRDLLRFMIRGMDKTETTAVRDAMRKDPIVATPETPLSSATHSMLSHRINCLPVVTQGRLAGIITSTDLLKVFQRVQGEREQRA
ncbi:MAG: CBS domain-containing protein [Candidatus Xenobia bacterium]